MKTFPLSLCCLLLSIAFLTAQEKPAKERKTMVFQPGAKTPDGLPAAPQVPANPPAVPLAGAPAAAGDESLQAAAAFFTLLQRGQIDEAYANLTRGSKIGER